MNAHFTSTNLFADPLLDLIARYRSGMATYNAAPPRNDEEDGGAFVQETYGDPLDALSSGPPAPTTIEGAIAGLEFVSHEMESFQGSDACKPVVDVCLSFLKRGDGQLPPQGIDAAASAGFLFDADRRHSELSDLINGADIDDDTVARLTSEQESVERAMVARSARSGDDIAAKARVLRRLIVGGNLPDAALPDGFSDDIGQMTWSLLSDVLDGKAGTIEPPVMPLAQMKDLYEVLNDIRHVVLAFCCQRRFIAAGGGYTEAGEFLDDFVELIGRVGGRIAERAEAMLLDEASDTYSDDFADRAEILIRSELECNGVTSAAALAARLYRQLGEAA